MDSSTEQKFSLSKTILACLLIAIATLATVFIIFLTEPEAAREGATRKGAMLVSTKRPDVGSFRPTFIVYGQVEAVRESDLSAQVSGRVVQRSERFQPGEQVSEGDLLANLESRDYALALRRAESTRENAQAMFDIEAGEQIAARDDYKRLNRSLPETQKSLVLRAPELQLAKARLDDAQAQVSRATLDLERSAIKAPFDGHIVERHIDIDAQLAVGQSLGHLVSSERYWIRAQVPTSYLPWLEFDQNRNQDAEVSIQDRSAWPSDFYRSGRLRTLVKRVNQETRMAEILIDVDDPLGRESDSLSKHPLLLNAFVQLQLKGRSLDTVARIPRDWLKANNKVWLNVNGKLEVRHVDVQLQDEEFTYITSGLSGKDEIVITNLSVVKDGADLQMSEQ